MLVTFYTNIRGSLTSQDLPLTTRTHLSNTIMIKSFSIRVIQNYRTPSKSIYRYFGYIFGHL